MFVSPSGSEVSQARFPYHLIPNPLALLPLRQMVVARMESPDFAAAVERAGGSAHFSIAASVAPEDIDVVTKSSNRDDANRTLAVVDSAIRQQFLHMQTPVVGTLQPEDLMRLATVARHTA